MDTVARYEAARLALQAALDGQRSLVERNRLGQFATPTALAREILLYSSTLLNQSSPLRFLDPAFGTGSFYSALLHTFSSDRIVSARGYEIDPHYGEAARQLWQHTPLQLNLDDFTSLPLPKTDQERVNLLICNPPYVRHHHISLEDKRRLQETAYHASGTTLGGLSGLYCYFLCIAHAWLAEGGIAGWLIPSEFLDVNYGRFVKEHLLTRVTLLHIHRFDPDDVQFDDALVSSAVVWFRKSLPSADHTVRFTFGGTLLQPKLEQHSTLDTLSSTTKWTRLPFETQKAQPDGIFRLKDLFVIKRGIATGANKYFVLSAEEAARQQLPPEFLTPILPSPRYLTSEEILAGSDGTPLVEPRLLLLHCTLPQAVVAERYPTLLRYFQSGVAAGISDRYLARHRTPWYAQEHRPPAPFLCTYMGRQRATNGVPFRFFLNHSCATAPNVYLLLYPKPPLDHLLRDAEQLQYDIWRLLSAMPLQILIGEGRIYGGGLHKLEPAELGNVPAEPLIALLPPSVAKTLRRPEPAAAQHAHPAQLALGF